MLLVTPDISEMISDLFKRAHIGSDHLEIKRIDVGSNNKSYCVTSENQLFFVKHYFTHPSDTRDRLMSEYAFSTYAASCASGLCAKPFAKNDDHRIALYEFLDGKPFSAGMVSQWDITQAAEFFCQLNMPKNKAMSVNIPQASEACFSVQDHLKLVSNRLIQLKNIPIVTDEDALALKLIEKLNKFWQKIIINIKVGQDILAKNQYCLSPSDFGFHNALKMQDGSVRFIDFEYAGWDDPAKMIGDFFAQIAVPIPDTFFDFFAQKTLQNFPCSEILMERTKKLYLVYRVKWCCIVLNVFLPYHMARRAFAHDNIHAAQIKRVQLDKASLLINSLEQLYG